MPPVVWRSVGRFRLSSSLPLLALYFAHCTVAPIAVPELVLPRVVPSHRADSLHVCLSSPRQLDCAAQGPSSLRVSLLLTRCLPCAVVLL